MRDEGRAAVAANPQDIMAHMALSYSDYMYSMHVLGENTLENAKKLGYLEVQELYPDVPKHPLHEFAKEFYAMEEPGEAYLRVM